MRIGTAGVALAALLPLGLIACASRPVAGRYELNTERLRESFLTAMMSSTPDSAPTAQRERYVDIARQTADAYAAGERGSYIHLYPDGKAEYVQIAQPLMVGLDQPSLTPQRYVGTWRVGQGGRIELRSMNREGYEAGAFEIEGMALLRRGRDLVLLPSEDVPYSLYFVRQ